MRRLKWAALLLAAIVFTQFTGLGPRDLWEMAAARLGKAKDDSQALASGEYSARVAASYRDEVAKLPPPPSNLGEDDRALQAELAQTRQKLLEDRAAALERHAGDILRGDVDTLKRQVAENARNASGGI